MRAVRTLRAAAVAVVLAVVAVAARADCNAIIRPISEPNQFPNRVAGPFATNGSVVMVAKLDNANSQRAIYVSTYDEPSLGPLTFDRQIVPTSLNGPIALLRGVTDFALFYQRNDFNIVMQRLSDQGEPIGNPIVLAPSQAFTQQEIEVIYDPFRRAYVMIRTVPQQGLWLTIINTDGSLAMNQQVSPFIGTPTSPRVAAMPNGTLGIVWVMTTPVVDQLHFMAIRPDNSLIFSSVQPISPRGRMPLIAANASTFLIITRHETVTGESTLHSIRMSPAGTFLERETPFLAPHGLDIASTALVWNPDLAEWAMAYVDYSGASGTGYAESRLLRFTDDGRPRSDSVFAPELASGFLLQLVDELVWSNEGYLGTGEFTLVPVQGSASSLMRHCPLLAHPRPVLRNQLLGSTVTFSAFATGGIPNHDFRWDFGDFSGVVTGSTVSHRFQRTGVHTITVTVTDRGGSTNQQSFQVNIVEPRRRPSRKR